jgi:hypothetical protein
LEKLKKLIHHSILGVFGVISKKVETALLCSCTQSNETCAAPP